jgi:hypothetical protein
LLEGWACCYQLQMHLQDRSSASYRYAPPHREGCVSVQAIES